jgi:hypothetical protein
MDKIPKPVIIVVALLAVALAIFGISRSLGGGNTTTVDKPMAPPGALRR